MLTRTLLTAATAAVVSFGVVEANPTPPPPPPEIIAPQEMPCGTGMKCLGLGVNVPGSPGGGTTSTTTDGPGKGLPWSAEHACYYRAVDGMFFTADGRIWGPENVAFDAAVDGSEPAQVLTECVYDAAGNLAGGMSWLAPYSSVPTVSPEQLARQAVQQMNLRAPQIGMTGGSPPEGMQIVGIPAWMWAADPEESTTPGVAGVEPIVRSASAGEVTVTATGRLDRTVWSMADGTLITCSGAKAVGTPWEARYDKAPSPTCGHTYTRTSAGQPNKAYTVTVTAYWVVDWSGDGQTGTINVEMSRNIPKQVGELQALIVPNGRP